MSQTFGENQVVQKIVTKPKDDPAEAWKEFILINLSIFGKIVVIIFIDIYLFLFINLV